MKKECGRWEGRSFREDASTGVCRPTASVGRGWSPDEFEVPDILKFTIPGEERDFLPAGNKVTDTIDRGEFFAGTRCFSFLVLS
jgi:hypothetical protein